MDDVAVSMVHKKEVVTMLVHGKEHGLGYLNQQLLFVTECRRDLVYKESLLRDLNTMRLFHATRCSRSNIMRCLCFLQ